MPTRRRYFRDTSEKDLDVGDFVFADDGNATRSGRVIQATDEKRGLTRLTTETEFSGTDAESARKRKEYPPSACQVVKKIEELADNVPPVEESVTNPRVIGAVSQITRDGSCQWVPLAGTPVRRGGAWVILSDHINSPVMASTTPVPLDLVASQLATYLDENSGFHEFEFDFEDDPGGGGDRIIVTRVVSRDSLLAARDTAQASGNVYRGVAVYLSGTDRVEVKVVDHTSGPPSQLAWSASSGLVSRVSLLRVRGLRYGFIATHPSLADGPATAEGVRSDLAVTPSSLAYAVSSVGNFQMAVDARATSVVNDRISNLALPGTGGSTSKAPSIAQVVAGLAGKEDTLADAVRVATGGTDGQLLSRSGSVTAWIDAPSGGGGGTTYTLPTATSSVLGGVRIAANLDDTGNADVTLASQVKAGLAFKADTTSIPNVSEFLTQAQIDDRVKSPDNAASMIARGNIELADQSEADTGTDNVKAMTPALVQRRIAAINIPSVAGFITQTVADGRYAALSHTHTIAQVTDLQNALDAKQATLSEAQTVVTGGTQGQLLARAASGGTEWVDAPSGGTPYTLPTASTTELGGVRIAANLDDTGNADVTLASQVKAGLAGKADTSQIPGVATTSVAGIVELATDDETQTGSDSQRAVTPAGLTSRRTTTGRTGLIQLATQSEVSSGTALAQIKAVTPFTLLRAVDGGGTFQTAIEARATSVVNARISNAALPSSGGSTTNAPSIAQVVAGLGGKQDTLSAAQTVVTGGTTGQLLSRAASGGTAWVDAPTGGGGSGQAFTVQAARPNNSQGAVGDIIYSTDEMQFYTRLTSTDTDSSSNTDWTELSSASGSGVSTTELYTSTGAASPGNLTLEGGASWSDYDALQISVRSTSSGNDNAASTQFWLTSILAQEPRVIGIYPDAGHATAGSDRIFFRFRASGIVNIAFALNTSIISIHGINIAAGSGSGGGGGTPYTLPQATTTVLGGVRLADISAFNAGALPVADRPRVVTLEDFREVFGVSNTGGAVAQPSLVRATTTKEGLVRIASAIATDNAQNNVAVPTVSQVRTALAGKEDTLADAVRVATGGTSGQLLSRAAGGGTSWIDAPSGGGNGGSTSGGLTKTNLYANASTERRKQSGTALTLSQSFKDFDLLYVQAQSTGTRDIGFSFADPAEITVGTTDTGSNEMGVFVDNAVSDRIFIRWETNTRVRIFFSARFRIVKIVGLNFAAGSGGGNGGTGATTFAALTDTPTAASLRANPSEALVTNVTGDEIVTQSLQAVVRDGVQTAGVGQTAVDNRVKSASNAMTTSTYGVGQLASGGDARALQPNDTGLINVDSLRQVVSDLDSRYSHAGGTQLSNALHQWDTHLSTIHTAGDTVYHGGFNRAWELTITDRANRTGTFAGDDEGLTFSGGNISGETSKQYGIWGFASTRRMYPCEPADAGAVDGHRYAAGSNVGRVWVSTSSANRLQIHNPSNPTSATTITSVDNSTGFDWTTSVRTTGASQLAIEVLKRRPNTPSDDGIEFLPTVIRADGTVVQCNNISFTSGWRAFNTSRIHLFETGGTITIDRVKFALHNGYESHESFAEQVRGNADTPVAWATRTTGTGSDTQAYNGDFDFLGRLKSQDADGNLQLVVGDNDARLPPDPKDATAGQLIARASGGGLEYVDAPSGGGGGGGGLSVETAAFSITPETTATAIAANPASGATILRPTVTVSEESIDGISMVMSAATDNHTEIRIDTTKFNATDLFQFDIQTVVGTWGSFGGAYRGTVGVFLQWRDDSVSSDTGEGAWKSFPPNNQYFRGGGTAGNKLNPTPHFISRPIPLAKAKRMRFYFTGINQGTGVTAAIGRANNDGATTFNNATANIVEGGSVAITTFRTPKTT